MASLLDKLKAGAEVVGKTAMTVGKRAIGDDSPTDLSPKTEETLRIESKKPMPKMKMQASHAPKGAANKNVAYPKG
jgi:hypothetical protein